MKKIILLTLCAVLCIVSACADVIQIDTETATIEELTAAHDAISAAIKNHESENVPVLASTEPFTISGNGTAILEGFSIPEPMYIMTARCDKDTKLTLYKENGEALTFGQYGCTQSDYCELFEHPVVFTSMMVETTGAWSFTFSQMGANGTLGISGSGSCISDIFTATPPQIVSIEITSDWFDLVTVYLYSITNNGKTHMEECVPWGTQVYGSETFDIIIKPSNDVVAYYWDVSCNKTCSWTITTK